MRVNTINYYLKEGFVNLWRNRTMTLASIISIAASLFTIGIIVLVVMNTNNMMNEIESKVEVTIFLKDDISQQQLDALGAELVLMNDVVNQVIFVSKEDALERTKEWLEEKSELLAGYDQENNPFPVSYVVRVDKPEYVEKVISAIKDNPHIEKIRYGEEIINTVVMVARITRYTGLALVLGLTLVSIVIISNTVKLAVFWREKEINIMKYVGATDWFIKWPLILEGSIIGLLGAMVGIALVSLSYILVLKNLNTSFFMIHLLSLEDVFQVISYGFICIGVTIGIMGTAVSMRKYLRV